jgi:nitroreductase
MNFQELITKRYSVRAYRPDPVPEDLLNKVLRAACIAPTASNEQPFGVIVVHTQGRSAELSQVYPQEWFVQAPLILVVCVIPEKAWRNKEGKDLSAVDAAIVMDHIVLAATDLGLGTCWVGAFDPQAARRLFQISEGVVPVVMTPLGFPADKAGTRERKPQDQLIHYEHWQVK